MRAAILLLGCLLAGVSANSQQDAKSKPGEFYDKELDLHFNYPVGMQTLDASSEMEQGHLNIYGHQRVLRFFAGIAKRSRPETNRLFSSERRHLRPLPVWIAGGKGGWASW